MSLELNAITALEQAAQDLKDAADASAQLVVDMAGQKAALESAKTDAESAATNAAASETSAAASAAQASDDAASVATVVNDAEATLQASVTERTSADVFLFMGV